MSGPGILCCRCLWGVKQISFTCKKWIVEKGIKNNHTTGVDNLHQISVWSPSAAQLLYYYN